MLSPRLLQVRAADENIRRRPAADGNGRREFVTVVDILSSRATTANKFQPD